MRRLGTTSMLVMFTALGERTEGTDCTSAYNAV